MLGFGKKRSVRRHRAKQFRAEASASPWQLFTHHIGVWPALVAAGFFVIVMIVLSVGKQALPFSLNQTIGQPIAARVEFTQNDPEQAAANTIAAREAVPNYYRINTELIDRIAGELTAMFEAAQSDSFESFAKRADSAPWPGDEVVYKHLNGANEDMRRSFTESLGRLKSALARERTALPTTDVPRDPPSTAAEVVVVRTEPSQEEGKPPIETEERIPPIQLIQVASRDAVEGRILILSQVFHADIRPAVRQVLIEALSNKPILLYEQKRTQEMMADAERNAPPGVKHFEKGKPFVFPRYREDADGIGQREELGLTPADIALLNMEAKAYDEFLRSDDPEAIASRAQRRYQQIGLGAILAILTLCLFVYVGLYQPRIHEVKTRSLAFAGLLLVCLVGVRVIDVRLAMAEFTLTPTLIAASILTIAYPRRFACGVTVIFVIMAAMAIRADMAIAITLLAGGYSTALLLHRIRTRTRILSSGMISALLVAITTFSFGLIDRQELGFALHRATLAAAAAILAALILQGILPFVERLFKVATALTLLEYRDANRPLLQRLAQEAPGTYNHSLVLANLAETACEAIGADGLLAHVGTLYHDVGKIQKPEYFAENQVASINRHDNLSPTMSLLIILGHVKDGLELAREYGLPPVLRPFIAEHHGTTVVRYFHSVASEKQPMISSGKHDREVAEAEFRYPGPKPASKETAILMLCDGVESAVRALPEPTAGRIESVVHQLVQARLKDGQFDDCHITLRELHAVEESLVKSLCRFYHGRVAYPKEASKEAKETAQPKKEEQKQEQQQQGAKSETT